MRDGLLLAAEVLLIAVGLLGVLVMFGWPVAAIVAAVVGVVAVEAKA